MRRINLPLIADTVFTAICVFLLVFTSVRYCLSSAFWGLFIAIPSAALGGILAFLYISKRQNKKYNLSKDQREIRLLAAHLALCMPEHITVLFLRLLGQSAKVKGKTVYCDDRACFFIFKFNALDLNDAAEIIKHGEAKKRVYCNSVLPEACDLFKQFDVEYIEINAVYKLLKDADLLPEKYGYDSERRQKFAERIKTRFNKKLCMPLFWSGLSLTLLSYFTFYPVYYIVSGGILLILAASALLFGKKA